MTTDTTERIQPGLGLLEREIPTWPERIDPDTLDLASGTRCVGGQLEGSYCEFATRFALHDDPVLAAAFNADHPSEAPALTEAWRVATERRRLAPRSDLPAV
jgi:hypothetical protein